MSSGFGVGELSLFMVLFAAHTDFLYRVCQLVGVHSNMHCLIRHSSVDRWTGGGGTAAQVYIPKSPLSALPAVAVLSGFSTEFMRSHTSGRATVAVPLA